MVHANEEKHTGGRFINDGGGGVYQAWQKVDHKRRRSTAIPPSRMSYLSRSLLLFYAKQYRHTAAPSEENSSSKYSPSPPQWLNWYVRYKNWIKAKKDETGKNPQHSYNQGTEMYIYICYLTVCWASWSPHAFSGDLNLSWAPSVSADWDPCCPAQSGVSALHFWLLSLFLRLHSFLSHVSWYCQDVGRPCVPSPFGVSLGTPQMSLCCGLPYIPHSLSEQDSMKLFEWD